MLRGGNENIISNHSVKKMPNGFVGKSLNEGAGERKTQRIKSE